MPRLRRHPRGSTLTVAITITAVLTIVAAGLIRRTNAEMESAGAKRNYDQAVSCADGARELLLSQFRAYGVDLSAVVMNETVGDRRLASGHYDQFGVQSVVPVDRTAVGAVTENAMDLANRTIRVALGGAFYRVTVVCSDSTNANRQAEVEFLIRFGL